LTSLRHTPLHAAHAALGAKLVPFAGYEMPLQYAGIVKEHETVRTAVGVFDVSHMGEADLVGPGAIAAAQRLVTNDVARLADHQAQYTVMCQDDGGIVDDCIVYRLGAEHLRIVINAANVAKDLAHMRSVIAAVPGCELVDRSDELALLAVQGPRAVDLVARLAEAPVQEVPSFGLATVTIAGVAVLAARTGYTGEDGFELFVPAEAAAAVWSAVLAAGAAPIGLGARDTLRLEARLSLYGNDIDATTSPLEAGLGWVVKLDKLDRGLEFVGGAALRRQHQEGVTRRLVGFVVDGKAIARPAADVLDASGAVVGRVTSGGPSPTLGGAIGLAYVPTSLSAPGTALRLSQRGRELAASVVRGPFYRRAG
jgi:aminomethyltransferase